MTADELQEFIQDTIGTTNSPDFSQFSKHELDEIDQQMFQCDQCGWWCNAMDEWYEGEEDPDEQLCDDCGKERE